MNESTTSTNTPQSVDIQYQPLPAVLSYLVPGLGQIYQGRIAKGVIFFVCIYALFFYGMFLGSGSVTLASSSGEEKTYRIHSNVYIPDAYADRKEETRLPPLAYNLYTRPQFLGQFWNGIVVWPALVQYLRYDSRDSDGVAPFGTYMRAPSEQDVNAVQTAGHKLMDLGWVYTVLAGVLNILIIYDALAGPAVRQASQLTPQPGPSP
jgi:hypothetical protein